MAAILDAWNRECIGWSITDHLRGEIVCDAFDMATWRRRPDPESGLMHHSDHGTQPPAGCSGSGSEPPASSDRWEPSALPVDAMAESFFATLQTELFDRRTWDTGAELAQAIFEYIKGLSRYNPHRRHSAIDYLSPVEYEMRWHTEHHPPKK